MADVTAGAARYASVAEVRADVERAGGDASVLCGFGRCFCVKTALGISGGKERGHWPQFQESERSNRVLLGTAIAAFDSLESGAKDSNIRQTMVWLLSRRRSRLSKLQHRWDLYEVPQASRLGTRMLRSV